MSIYYLSFEEICQLHSESITQYGGADGIRDEGLIRSAVAQPQSSFGGVDLYATLVEKAAALGFSLVKNHGFVDGNKRIGLAALDLMLRLNAYYIDATIDELQQMILDVAASQISRIDFTNWVSTHTKSIAGD